MRVEILGVTSNFACATCGDPMGRIVLDLNQSPVQCPTCGANKIVINLDALKRETRKTKS
jgi:DNA-directed RNA polymerase subunit RPC12/RpoP